VDVNYYNYPALPLLSRPFNGWMAAHTLLPYVRNYAPDILLSYFVYPEGYAALLVGKALNIPVIATGLGSDINRISDRITALKTRKVLREADFLFTVSDHLRQKSIAMGAHPETSRALINGCDLAVFKVGNRLEARTRLGIDPAIDAAVYIGRMDVNKGLRELVEAAVALHAKRPNLHVYLVGEGPDRPIIESTIQSHHASGYVHALPGCPPSDVFDWMTAANLVTLPSYMEGCPNVVLEALACGRPVVSTNVGGIPEIMSDECGRLVPARDSVALVEAIASVLDKPWDAAAIRDQRSRSWETVAEELHGVSGTVIFNYHAKHHAS
jgi:glycosyltransferase involved in cell wall biosynthesis